MITWGGSDTPVRMRSRLQAAQFGHPGVPQHHVGAGTADSRHGFGAGGRLRHHVDAVGREDHPEARTGEGLVVGDQIAALTPNGRGAVALRTE